MKVNRLELLVGTSSAHPVVRIVHVMHHLSLIRPVYLIHVRGDISGQKFCDFLLSTYEEVVHWKSWFLMGKQGEVLCRNLIDCIEPLWETQLFTPLH